MLPLDYAITRANESSTEICDTLQGRFRTSDVSSLGVSRTMSTFTLTRRTTCIADSEIKTESDGETEKEESLHEESLQYLMHDKYTEGVSKEWFGNALSTKPPEVVTNVLSTIFCVGIV